MTVDRPWHYIRSNESNRMPRRHVFLGVAEHTTPIKGGIQRTWRLAWVRFISRDRDKAHRDYQDAFVTPEGLWAAIDRFCRRRARLVVWSHNLGYDLRLSRALEVLPTLGWELAAHNLSDRGSWLTWRKDQRTIVMSDAISVFGQPLAQMGKWVGLAPHPHPAETAGDDVWQGWLRRNVHILSETLLEYLQWIEDDDLGNWAMTGSGQGWNAFRHRFMSHKICVHDDEEALEAERRAMWCGRNEAYWHGTLVKDVVQEWDFHAAYATIARDYRLPVRLMGEIPPGFDWRAALDDPTIAILAEVDCMGSDGSVPMAVDDRIVWPVGYVHTTLWTPELRSLLAADPSTRLIRGWIYRTAPCLRDWAHWILGLVDDRTGDIPAWMQSVAKYWSRSVVGRAALRHTKWDLIGTAQGVDVYREDVWDARTDETYEITRVGGRLWRSHGQVEASDSAPMLTGYVMSIGRAHLWAVLQALPARTAMYVDTDSVLVRAEDEGHVARFAALHPSWGLRLKRSYEGVTIWGPRQLVTGTVVRVAGMPVQAARTSETTFSGAVWQTLATAAKTGRIDSVVSYDRHWTIRGTDRRRRPGAHGWTEPIALGPPDAA